jgi:hypothetical protein
MICSNQPVESAELVHGKEDIRNLPYLSTNLFGIYRFCNIFSWSGGSNDEIRSQPGSCNSGSHSLCSRMYGYSGSRNSLYRTDYCVKTRNMYPPETARRQGSKAFCVLIHDTALYSIPVLIKQLLTPRFKGTLLRLWVNMLRTGMLIQIDIVCLLVF